MQKEPLVSVIMSAYNAESTLENAIESILSQSFSNFEFLIMNDGSNDMTSEIIENYSQNDKRIRVFQNEKNKGLTKSLNILINLSKPKKMNITINNTLNSETENEDLEIFLVSK